MPQFAQIDTFPSQIFWLLVTFTILYILLSRVVLPRIGDVVTNRQKKIDDDLGKAEALQAQAAAAKETYEATLAKSAEDARAIHRSVAEDMAKKAEKDTAKLMDKLAKQAEEADARIAETKQTALAELQSTAVEVVQAATERLIGGSVDEKAAKGALDQVGGAK